MNTQLTRVSQSSQPKFSIVILNYNGLEMTKRCIESVENSKYDREKIQLILVDNGSNPREQKEISKIKTDFTVILERNQYYAKGFNAGIKHSKGDYVIVLSNDTSVHPDWLNIIHQYMRNHPYVGIAQPKLLTMGTNKLDTSIPKIKFLYRAKCVGFGEEDNGQYDCEEIDYACGACIVIRKRCLNQIGMFDESFKMHCEDMELSIRAKKHGWEIGYIPKAKVWHIREGTMKNINSWFVKWLLLRNRIRIIRKYGLIR